MSGKNPTGVKMGMAGKFFGQTYRVVGHARLGEMEWGKIYYWHEYYLQPSDGGELVTLVYEKTGWFGQWRWFSQFDPEKPLTAAEARMKREGDLVTIDEHTMRVVLLRESRVYEVQGHTPEGVVIGAHATYFNAEDDDDLFVVSWTGDEVEFYRGVNITRGAVATAFKVTMTQLMPKESVATFLWITIAGVAVIALCFAMSTTSSPSYSSAKGIAPIHLPAPALKIGASGTLRGAHYRIENHAEVEIDEVGVGMTRHEYYLRDDDGNSALLIYGWHNGEKSWLLLKPMHPNAGNVVPTPNEAGGKKLGDKMVIGDVNATVKELFLCKTLSSDSTNDFPGAIRYGLVGRAGAEDVLLRWDEHSISFSEGGPLLEQNVMEAFGDAARK